VLTEEYASHWLTSVKIVVIKDRMDCQFELLAQNTSHLAVSRLLFHLQLKYVWFVLCSL